MWWLYLVIAIVACIVVFFAVIIIRTLRFKPQGEIKVSNEKIEFDEEKAVSNLQELVRCKTVSYYDHSKEDNAEFEKLIAKLPILYPNVSKNCKFTRFEDRGIMFKWE